MKMRFGFLFSLVIVQAFALPVQMEEVLPPLPKDVQNRWSPYIKAGAIIIAPNLGVGMRYRYGQHGCDFSVNGASIERKQMFLSGKALYQYWSRSYPGLYFGAGAGGSYYKDGGWLFRSGLAFPSLEQSIGYEWSRKNAPSLFTQFELSESIWMDGGMFILPIPGISCGVRF